MPPAEVEPLARAIVELTRDPERAARMGRAGRERALVHFLEARATDRTEILYRAFLDADSSDGVMSRPAVSDGRAGEARTS